MPVVAILNCPDYVEEPQPVLLLSPDSAWCRAVAAALAGDGRDLNLRPQRVDSPAQLAGLPGNAGRLWLVDECWLAPALAALVQPRVGVATGRTGPELIVRLDDGTDENLVAAIAAGARGCLLQAGDADEALRAVRAVLQGELWLSRRVYSRLLDRLLDRLLNRPVARVVVDEEGDGLTERQHEIAGCVARGMSNKQIARHLGISPTTVKTHLHNIFERMGVSGRTLLALRATEGHVQ